MKRIFKMFAVIACVALFGACSMSMDTLKYHNGTDKLIQTVPCEVATVDEAPVVIAETKATKIKILEPVMFDFDKAKIRADQEVVINKVADLMAEYPDTTLVLNGHASVEGPGRYNLELSQRRADAVKAALIAKGVSEDRIVAAIGKGEVSIFGKLLKLNRRVVILSVD